MRCVPLHAFSDSWQVSHSLSTHTHQRKATLTDTRPQKNLKKNIYSRRLGARNAGYLLLVQPTADFSTHWFTKKKQRFDWFIQFESKKSKKWCEMKVGRLLVVQSSYICKLFVVPRFSTRALRHPGGNEYSVYFPLPLWNRTQAHRFWNQGNVTKSYVLLIIMLHIMYFCINSQQVQNQNTCNSPDQALYFWVCKHTTSWKSSGTTFDMLTKTHYLP